MSAPMATMLFLFSLVSFSRESEGEIFLSPGETHFEKLTSREVYNSNGHAIKVRPAPGGVVFVARTRGLSLVRLGSHELRVRVVSPETARAHHILAPDVSSMRGLYLRVRDDSVAIEGILLRLWDWKKLVRIAKSSDLIFTFAAEISESLRSEALDFVREMLPQSTRTNLDFSFEKGIRAKLTTKDKAEVEYAHHALRSFGIVPLVSESDVHLEPMVGIKILVAEVKKKFLQKIGVEWPSTYQASLLPNPTGPTAADIFLQALEERGEGRVLASPYLLTTSGKDSQFLVGGEIPIRVSHRKDAHIEWKKYGILLTVSPKADDRGRMSISLTTEVSSIDTSQVVDGVPGFFSNRVATHFDLDGPRHILLSGIIHQQEGTSHSGLPWLSRIPILGLLFSSEDYRTQKSELIISVRPEVVKNGEL